MLKFAAVKYLLSFIVLSLSSLGIAASPEPVNSGVTCELIGTYDVDRLNRILTTELKEFSDDSVTFPPAAHAVKLYRIVYPSVIPEQANRPTVASGLLALPDTADKTLPVVSYQHGTIFSKTEVPSNPDESMETRLMLAQFAGQEYAVVAADYFGKGVSPEKDSYIVKASTQQACLDHLKAAQAASRQLGHEWGPLFLSGWSQGGWATMAFLNKLESVGIPVTAAATASAPNSPYALINGWIFAPAENQASYIPAIVGIQILAAAEYHRLPGLAELAFRADYREAIRSLYLNKITWEQANLPTKSVKELLREEFFANEFGEASRYWQIVRENDVYSWRSRTPLRCYYGESDEVVSPYLATLPANFQKAVGGAATVAVNAGAKANHRGTFVFAVAEQKKWFDELRQGKP